MYGILQDIQCDRARCKDGFQHQQWSSSTNNCNVSSHKQSSPCCTGLKHISKFKVQLTQADARWDGKRAWCEGCPCMRQECPLCSQNQQPWWVVLRGDFLKGSSWVSQWKCDWLLPPVSPGWYPPSNVNGTKIPNHKVKKKIEMMSGASTVTSTEDEIQQCDF